MNGRNDAASLKFTLEIIPFSTVRQIENKMYGSDTKIKIKYIHIIALQLLASTTKMKYNMKDVSLFD